MTALVITCERDIATLAKRIAWLGYPCTVSIRRGAKRSLSQNRLQMQWCNDIATQLGDRTAEDVRAYVKLHHGIPIRREDEAYADAYDRIIRPLPYEVKLEMMRAPLDWPVTRDMTTKQLTRYLDSIQQEFAPMVTLTDPEAMKWI